MSNINVVFSTSNKGKLAEACSWASKRGISILSPEELRSRGLLSVIPEVVEDGDTYEANARKKAHALAIACGMPAIGDDTGLEVDALHGAPGIFSARYAGEPSNSVRNVEKLLTELSGQNNRAARFVCVLVYVTPAGVTQVIERILEGEIALAPTGSAGFGYDSVFIVSGTGKTLAQLKSELPEVETHRSRALRDLFALL